MGGSLKLGWLLLSVSMLAQAEASHEVERARQEAEHVRDLVEAGALPRNALREAELVLAEVLDEALLKETLYSSTTIEEQTELQIAKMIAAAERLVERQKQEWEKAKQLVEKGALPHRNLGTFEQELNKRRQTLELARQHARLFNELMEMAQAEEAYQISLEKTPQEASMLAERYDGNGVFLASQLQVIRLTYEHQFHVPLPVSANGDTALHRSLGFDHSGLVDVALHPDQPEGRWLLDILEEMSIPYFVFRSYVPGKSTGAHIHIGPPSKRIQITD